MLNKIKLKVCGMRDGDNIMQVASCNPDYMGFIYFAKSPRHIGENFNIPLDFPSSIKRVGVFVNEVHLNIKKQIKNLQLDYVQLHGRETTELCEQLKDDGVGVIKVFSVDDVFNFNTTNPYKEVVDYFLFDTKGKYYGGNARVFNWNILKHYDQEVPFFLSGGIGPENVAEISSLKDMNIHALDINSGVEEAPGMKDIKKIKDLQDILITL